MTYIGHVGAYHWVQFVTLEIPSLELELRFGTFWSELLEALHNYNLFTSRSGNTECNG